MGKRYFLLVFLCVYSLGNLDAWSQQGGFWSKTEGQAYHLEIGGFKRELAKVSQRKMPLRGEKIRVQFPLKNGQMLTFLVMENPVMTGGLARKFPDNKSYAGVAESNPAMRINFSLNELGLHAMITGPEGEVHYIDPTPEHMGMEAGTYEVYKRSDLQEEKEQFRCFTEAYHDQAKRKATSVKNYDQKLRTYRLALATTGEYAQYHIAAAGAQGKSEQEQKAVVLAAMTTAMTRVNSLFENDLAIRFELVENNEDLIFLSPGVPFVQGDTESDAINLLNKNQQVCDNYIGSDGYDLGHVLSTMPIGYGNIISVCNDNTKARGTSGARHPVGEYFYFDMIAHELGHQFGANHTFNGDAGGCDGRRSEPTAVEPGSGSSIMAYAGYCFPQDVQAHSDLYFHSVSIQEIRNFLSNGGSSCAVQSSIPGNSSSPLADAGEDFMIPVGTPFKLVGKAIDQDDDLLTFCWEQVDPYINRVPPNGNDRYGTLYRSYRPTKDSVRYFPALKELRNGALSGEWEATPLIDRDFNFSLTVRDNNAGGGLIGMDRLFVEVTDVAGPFVVNSQNQPGTVWQPGSDELIEWDVAGTDSNGVDVSKVNILLSTDGGLSYPITLLANIDNDGSALVRVPDISASSCYLMVEAVDHYFFALNRSAFSIGEDKGICKDFAAEAVTLDIPDNQVNGVISTLEVTEDLDIETLSVTLSIEHPYVSDLSVELESPSGTKVVLLKEMCSGGQGIQVVFADTGENLQCSGLAPAVQGKFKPLEGLSAFRGENARGNWKLRVIDYYPEDVGQLMDWSLNLCSYQQVLAARENELHDFMVFPNPANESFELRFTPKAPEVQLELYDVLGRLVLQQSYQSSSKVFTQRVATSSLRGGVYMLKVTNGNHYSVTRLVKN